MNHIRGTDGWFRSMLVLEVRVERARVESKNLDRALTSPIENRAFLRLEHLITI